MDQNKQDLWGPKKKQYIKRSIDDTYLIQVQLAWDAIAKSHKLWFNYDHLLVIILRDYS